MDLNSRIYLAGHKGLVGSALFRKLRAMEYNNLLYKKHNELDLTDQLKTLQFFQVEKPEIVILAAAKVGGIVANNAYPVEFLYENLAIQNNVISAALHSGVQKLLFLGANCAYPRDCPQPIKEEYLFRGELEPTNRAYALAKLAGIEFCWASNRQYGTRFFCVMPANLYGPGDNFDHENSHVIPGLIRRIDEAKKVGKKEVSVWGTGKPEREFLYCDDLADACLFLLSNLDNIWGQLFTNDQPPIVNIGSGESVTIEKLAQLICKVIGFSGNITFDHTKPTGMPSKVMDIGKMTRLGWAARTKTDDGIKTAFSDYLKRYARE